MKMIIVVAGFVFSFTVMVVFIMALIRVGRAKTAAEQMLEDEDQSRYLNEWLKRRHEKHCFVHIVKLLKKVFGHKVESSKH